MKDNKSDEKTAPVTAEQQITAARLMGLLGLALVAGFFLTIAYSVYENSKTIAVQGVVKHVSSQTSYSGSSSGNSGYTTYSHSFQYVDRGGVERTGKDEGERQSRYKNGETVSIGYYPNDQNRIRIHSWFGLWKLQMVLLGLGSFLIYYMFAAIKLIKANEYYNQPDLYEPL